MRVIEPSFEILAMPRGEEALALLERIGRTAYKSEGKIDDGRDLCPHCGLADVDDSVRTSCVPCYGRGWNQVREPSSHRFLRMILKTDRRQKLAVKVRNLLGAMYEGPFDLRELTEADCRNVVDLCLNDVSENPPHESVIEHCGATVLFTSNRGFTHELVRHRLCAFTQESTRYCNYDKDKFGHEITVTERVELKEEKEVVEGLDHWFQALCDAEVWYMHLTKRGISPQIARDVLPTVLKADIVCTANFREWRHIFKMRCSPAAHPDMRRLMLPLREEFRKRVPIVFDET